MFDKDKSMKKMRALTERKVICLDGEWQCTQTSDENQPGEFAQKCPVPGLVDMAEPPFQEVGKKSPLRKYFWYRRTFEGPKELPDFAFLKIHKATYGTAVWLNGEPLGEQLQCFTPTIWNLRSQLKAGCENEVLVRLGADREILPKGIPTGNDFEKSLYIPGIYDSTEVILCNGPRLVNVQVVPDIKGQRVRLLIEIESSQRDETVKVEAEIAEVSSGAIVSTGIGEGLVLQAEATLDLTLPVPDAHLWSPEDPFLYEVRLRTIGDSLSVRFGMREFHFDPVTKLAVLNGTPRYLTGTNVTIHRFFEDKLRENLPWDREWVRQLHRQFKAMNWQIIRHTIGFPPEFWYDIADEEGFLIEDEFPIWTSERDDKNENLRAELMIPQYRDWIRERWNHPCVVIWDAQNESEIDSSSHALMAVRHLDYSNRPWENGYAEPQSPYDCVEVHPYLFIQGAGSKKHLPLFRLSDLANTSPRPELRKRQEAYDVAIIINEYDWMWLNRDGTPTTLSKHNYVAAFGPDATPKQCREYHARAVAALTEFWRCHRQVTGVMHFCGLGYSRPDGATSDDLIDVRGVEFEPCFFKYVGDSFQPVALMLDFWKESVAANSEHDLAVIIINDRQKSWHGEITLRLQSERQPLAVKTARVGTNGRVIVSMKVIMPNEPGNFVLIASLVDEGRTIESFRDIKVMSE